MGPLQFGRQLIGRKHSGMPHPGPASPGPPSLPGALESVGFVASDPFDASSPTAPPGDALLQARPPIAIKPATKIAKLPRLPLVRIGWAKVYSFTRCLK